MIRCFLRLLRRLDFFSGCGLRQMDRSHSDNGTVDFFYHGDYRAVEVIERYATIHLGFIRTAVWTDRGHGSFPHAAYGAKRAWESHPTYFLSSEARAKKLPRPLGQSTPITLMNAPWWS